MGPAFSRSRSSSPVEAEIGRLEIGRQFAARVAGLRLHVHVERQAVDRADTLDVEGRRERVSIERGNDSPDLRQSRRAGRGDLEHRLLQVSLDHAPDSHVAFSSTNAHLFQIQVVVTNGQSACQLLQCQVRRRPVEADVLERHAEVHGFVQKAAFDVKAVDVRRQTVTGRTRSCRRSRPCRQSPRSRETRSGVPAPCGSLPAPAS